MPNSTTKHKLSTSNNKKKSNRSLSKDTKDPDSSENELKIDASCSFKTPSKKTDNKTVDSPTHSSWNKKKRRRIRKSSTGEDEKLDLAIEDIEDTIQSCIKKNKELTPDAIKIILRKLVKNEHVLAICRLKEEELLQKSEENGNDADDENDEVIPKLTRAKAKQMDKKLLPLVPLKTTKTDTEVVEFLQKEIHDEDETDPEYQPEEDPNTTISDMDSLPATPQSVRKPENEVLIDGVFKIPRIRNESLTQSEGEAEPICKRTRTRLCLETTPIETLESTLVAPDITVDMYDHDKDVDKHWADFLNQFTKPFNPHADDADDPSDDEFQPGKHVPLDKEELADVAISKKEYNTLLKELMEIVDTMDDSFLDVTTEPSQIETKEVERKLRSPRSVRKKVPSAIISDPCPNETLTHETDLNTPEKSESFGPNLMSTMNESTIENVNGDQSSVQVDTFLNDTARTSESEKSSLINLKSTLSLSIQNPINAEQWISLDGINLLNYAQYQNGVFYLPTTQKILIEVPTEQLLKSISSQSDTKIILTDSINESLNSTARTIDTSNILSNSTTNDSVFSSKIRRVKQEKTYDYLDFSPPTPDLNTNQTGFTEEQAKILDQQLRMHIQLSTQNYLQTYSHPKYWKEADGILNFLYELDFHIRWSEQYPALRLALDQTEQWKKFVDSENGKEVVDWFYQEWEKEKESKEKISKWYQPKLCPRIVDLMLSSPVFAFPRLLPEMAFKGDYYNEKNKSEILTGEEILIALGLERFAKERKEEVDRMNKTAGKIKWKVTLHYLSEKISLNIVKCRSTKAIRDKILFWKNSPVMSPVKYWIKYGLAPNIIYKIEELDLVRLPRDYPDLLSTKWKQYLRESITDHSDQKLKKSTLRKEVKVEKPKNKSSINQSTKIASGDAKLQFQIKYGENSLICGPKNIEIDVNNSHQEIESEEDLPLGLRIKRKKETLRDLEKKKRGPKPSLKTYKNTLKSIVPEFKQKIVYLERKYEKRNISRRVKKSKILYEIFQKIKCFDNFSSCLQNSNYMATAPQNLKKMIKSSITSDKKKVVPENDTIYAQNFFDKVEETLLTANKFDEYEKFADILKSFDPSKERVADLYYKMEKIFHPNHPELLSLFLTFLEPGQAMQVGKFFEHFMMTNLSTFIEKLNKYFMKQPAQIKRIYNCLNDLSSMENVTIEMVKDNILPLLKGNPLLIDWFQQMFASEKPIDCHESDSETLNCKKTTSENVDSIQVYEELVLSDNPTNTETPACGIRYYQGNIMYSGRTCTLPAKLSFLAHETVIQMEKKEQTAKKNQKSKDTKPENCCHAVKSYAETRLQEKIKAVGSDKDVNSSQSSDEVENQLGSEKDVKIKRELAIPVNENNEDYYSTDDEQPKLVDPSTLKVHAIRLNPMVHARNGESFSDMSHLLTSPQNIVEKYFSDDTKSPTKKTHTPSTSSQISAKTTKKLLISPKTVGKSIKSPTQTKKVISDSMPENSQALSSGKRLKILIESDQSDVDTPNVSNVKRSKKLKIVRSDRKIEKEEDEAKSGTETARVKSPEPSTSSAHPESDSEKTEEVVKEPWTREEDKFILEEQRKGYENVEELVTRLKTRLCGRSTDEITQRYEFLMDLLRKIQQSS
uniref:CSON000955 protein n=1 Tax=Culicoides sonorensis TaxID=179676 RepID=A0A336MFL2_CULSO